MDTSEETERRMGEEVSGGVGVVVRRLERMDGWSWAVKGPPFPSSTVVLLPLYYPVHLMFVLFHTLVPTLL